MRAPLPLTALVLSLAAGGAIAAKLPVYDDFTEAEFNSGKWIQAESVRELENGALTLARWSFGGTASDIGQTSEVLSLSATDTAPAKSLKVTVKATDLDRIDGCATNPTPSSTRARLMGAFFSTRAGGPVPGDMVGDVLASLQLRRLSNSADPAGTVRIQAMVMNCNVADCASANLLGTLDLGTATLGQKVTFQIDWDRANQGFVFKVDAGLPSSLSYAGVWTRTGTPALPFNQVAVKNDVANCTAGRVKAGMGASFDNFAISH